MNIYEYMNMNSTHEENLQKQLEPSVIDKVTGSLWGKCEYPFIAIMKDPTFCCSKKFIVNDIIIDMDGEGADEILFLYENARVFKFDPVHFVSYLVARRFPLPSETMALDRWSYCKRRQEDCTLCKNHMLLHLGSYVQYFGIDVLKFEDNHDIELIDDCGTKYKWNVFAENGYWDRPLYLVFQVNEVDHINSKLISGITRSATRSPCKLKFLATECVLKLVDASSFEDLPLPWCIIRYLENLVK
jgi:asparagine synthetase B (glutamine-hydrolysing)